jgi:predicted  nucleic acid-binding Zn-ribbon protein
MADVQKSMQKMALVLERLVQKVDELEQKIERLQQQKSGGDEKSGGVSKSGTGSFLGAMAGAVAGLGLAHILFDDSIAPQDVANHLGLEPGALENIEEKIEGIDEKLEDMDKELEELLAQTEAFDDGISDEEFEQMSLDDYLASEEGVDDFDDV